MNVLIRELKANAKATLFWTLGIAAMVGVAMAKYDALGINAQMATLLNDLPASVKALFGVGSLDYNRASGFYGASFLFVVLLATLQAVLLGSGILSKEERDHTSEFLYVRPATRGALLSAKALAALVCVVFVNLVTWGVSVALVGKFAHGEPAADYLPYIQTMMGGLALQQVLFLALGLACAAVLHRPKAAPALAAGILLATYFLSAAIDINGGLSALRVLTPFQYFDAKALYGVNHLAVGFVALSLGITAALVVAAYVVFPRRDIQV